MLRKLLREENPSWWGGARRGEDLPQREVRGLQGQPPAHAEDLASQLPLIRRALEAYRIPILELAGYEADDVLGRLSCRAVEAGYDVVLVSADKDLMQLVEPRVLPLSHGPQQALRAAGSGGGLRRAAGEGGGRLALMGDSIDNIPGVPGIGEKGAKRSSRSTARSTSCWPGPARSPARHTAKACSATKRRPGCRRS